MARTLDADTLATYQADRLAERVERVQNEAEGRVQRLDSLVDLDEEQKDQAFAILAHSSEYFDPSMQFEGLENELSGLRPGMDANKSIEGILRPEQLQRLGDRQRERRDDAFSEFEELGLTPPQGWEEMESGAY